MLKVFDRIYILNVIASDTFKKTKIENWSQLHLNFNAEILRINDIETCFGSPIIEDVKGNEYYRIPQNVFIL